MRARDAPAAATFSFMHDVDLFLCAVRDKDTQNIVGKDAACAYARTDAPSRRLCRSARHDTARYDTPAYYFLIIFH